MKRTNYMDALRSVLMLLGVVYHSALVFDPGYSWRVEEPQENALLGRLAHFLHAFRMPAFFLVAGYFCVLLINKYGENAFMRNRLQRIAVPLLTTALLINPWTNYFSANHPAQNASAYLLSSNYLVSGDWIVQLWFLNDLLVFCLLCFVGLKLGRAIVMSRVSLNRFLDYVLRLPTPAFALGLMAVLPLGNAMIARAIWHLVDSEPVLAGTIDPGSLARYLPYFLFGCLIWHSETLRKRFKSVWFWFPALTTASLLWWMAPTTEGDDAPRYVEFAQYLVAWGMSSLCLAFFHRFLNQPSSFLRYLSDASYTVYLMHMLFIVTIGSVLAKSGFPVYAKFGLLMVGTAAASLAVHHFMVKRVAILSLLFNGKMPVPRKPIAIDVPQETSRTITRHS